MAEKKLRYNLLISFSSEQEKEDFRNYIFSRKLSHRIPVYQTLNEMLELHREKMKEVKQ